MSQPGWYADPDGTPSRLRYWDGRAWTAHVQQTPAWASEPTRRRVRPGVVALVVGLVIAALVLAFVLAQALGLVGRRALPPLAPPPGPVPTASPATSNAPTTRPPTPTTPAGVPSRVPLPDRYPSVAPTPGPAMPTSAGAPPCDSTTRAGVLTDGFLSVNVDQEWTRRAPSSWLMCGQEALVGTSTGEVVVTVGQLPGRSMGDLEAMADLVVETVMLDQGQWYREDHAVETIAVEDAPAFVIDSILGEPGAQQFACSVLVVETTLGPPSVVVTLTGADDREGLERVRGVLATLMIG